MADGWGMEIKYRLNIPNLKIGICKVRNLKLLRAVITLPVKIPHQTSYWLQSEGTLTTYKITLAMSMRNTTVPKRSQYANISK